MLRNMDTIGEKHRIPAPLIYGGQGFVRFNRKARWQRRLAAYMIWVSTALKSK